MKNFDNINNGECFILDSKKNDILYCKLSNNTFLNLKHMFILSRSAFGNKQFNLNKVKSSKFNFNYVSLIKSEDLHIGDVFVTNAGYRQLHKEYMFLTTDVSSSKIKYICVTLDDDLSLSKIKIIDNILFFKDVWLYDLNIDITL